MKKCSTCRKQLSFNNFVKDKNTKTGYNAQCKKCRRKYNQEYVRRPEVKAKARLRNKDPKIIAYHKNWHLKKRYNITLEEWSQILQKQNNKCMICKDPLTFKLIPVDHSHTSGKIRGILCNFCNRGLGWFKDSPDVLRRAANYLEGIPEVM